MRWFFKNRKTFVAFSTQLKRASNSFYASEIMACLMNQFWSDAQLIIVKRKLIPFVMYILSTAFYMQM